MVENRTNNHEGVDQEKLRRQLSILHDGAGSDMLNASNSGLGTYNFFAWPHFCLPYVDRNDPSSLLMVAELDHKPRGNNPAFLGFNTAEKYRTVFSGKIVLTNPSANTRLVLPATSFREDFDPRNAYTLDAVPVQDESDQKVVWKPTEAGQVEELTVDPEAVNELMQLRFQSELAPRSVATMRLLLQQYFCKYSKRFEEVYSNRSVGLLETEFRSGTFVNERALYR